MLEFHPVSLTDKGWIERLLAGECTRSCEYNFATLYLWGRLFGKEVARMGDRLVVRMGEGGETCYLYPAGNGPLAPVLDAMKADALARGAAFRLIGVPQEYKEQMESELPGRFCYESDRDSFDYIYAIDKLADLRGKKLHAKRNHINRFDENNLDWMFEALTEDNLPEFRAMVEEWYACRRSVLDEAGWASLNREVPVVADALDHWRELELEGGLIRTAGRVVAFALGSRQCGCCYDVHFEKAFDDIQGAYSVINREFARHIRDSHPEIRYINREDDVGLEGLRKAKLSYYPEQLLEKYIVTEGKEPC